MGLLRVVVFMAVAAVLVAVAEGAKADYYDILGIQKDASPALIRRAFRRKAAKVHPDRAKDDPNAKKQFLEISKAYDVLSDPKKRAEYDQFGADYVEQKEQGGHQQQQHGGFDFSQFFRSGGGGGGFRFDFGDGGGDGGESFFGFGGHHQQHHQQHHRRHHQQQQHHHQELFTEASNVTLLSSDAFKSEVLQSHKPWLIMYFSNSCQHCHDFAPSLERLADKLKHIVNVGAVDCERSRKACKNVAHYPEFHLFVGEEEDGQHERDVSDAIEYEGSRDGVKLGNWVLQQLPTNVVNLRKFSDYKKEFEDSKAFLTLPTCILFSTKSSIPPLFSAVSRDFGKHFDFAFVSVNGKNESRLIMDALNVKEADVPLMLMKNFVVPGARTARLQGKANLSFEKMTEFLTAYSTAMQQLKAQGLKKKAERHEEEVSHELTPSNWDELCPVNGAFLCVVGVHVQDGEAMTELAKRFAKDRLRFMHVLESEQGDSEAVRALRSASETAAVVVVNRRKGKWSVGPLASARPFLETIVSGSGKWSEQNAMK